MTVTFDSFCSSFCHRNKTKNPSYIFLRNVLWQINPNFTNARGECYDTAATVPWKKYSVKMRIILIATETGIIRKFLKKSIPNTRMKLVHLNAKNESKKIHKFCLTRCTIRVELYSSAFHNHDKPRDF